MKVPKLSSSILDKIFVEGPLFGAIDSNLAAWLQQEWNEAEEVNIISNELNEHKDNKELIDSHGGEKLISRKTLQPQQIKYLVENELLQKNGLSNLFFVYSVKEEKVFIVGVVWDKTIKRFVPYIYRTRNLYRAWTKGNLVFTKE